MSSLKSLWPEKVSHLIVICMVRQTLDYKQVFFPFLGGFFWSEEYYPTVKQAEWEEICSVGCSVQNLHLALTSQPGLAGFWSSHNWCR